MSRTHSRKHWSDAETTKALSLRAKGHTYQQIADALGRTLPAVAFRFRLTMHNEPETVPDTPRHCLRCKVEFMAFGRFNRLCERCTQIANNKIVENNCASTGCLNDDDVDDLPDQMPAWSNQALPTIAPPVHADTE